MKNKIKAVLYGTFLFIIALIIIFSLIIIANLISKFLVAQIITISLFALLLGYEVYSVAFGKFK